MKVAFTLMMLAAIGGSAAFVPAPSNPVQPADLLGADPDQVIERFGLPDQFSCGTACVQFHYVDTGGELVDFVFSGDVLVRAPDGEFTPKQMRKAPADRAYSGQRLETAVVRLGNPTSVHSGTSTVRLVYADGVEARVCMGRVFLRNP